MTLCKPSTGDRGQRYQVMFFDGAGNEQTLGWTVDADGGGLVPGLKKHPVWKLSRIIDRHAKDGETHNYKFADGETVTQKEPT